MTPTLPHHISRLLARAALLATVVASVTSTPAVAAPGDAIAALVQRSSVRAGTSVYVWDQTTRSVVYANAAGRPATPASTMKLLTSAAAISSLGADHVFTTNLAGTGSQQGTRWVGDLYLVGGGDPSLSTAGYGRDNFASNAADIGDLITPLEDAGITAVAGDIYVDDHVFDKQRWVGSWKRAFRLDETGALGGLTVNESRLGRWNVGRSTTAPAVYAGSTLRSLMIKRGIFVSGGVIEGRAPVFATSLAHVDSPPLIDLVTHMNRASDNFFAETLLKDIAAARAGASGGASTATGATLARQELQRLGADTTALTWLDGSGLSYGNRVTARLLGQTLGLGAQATWGRDWIDSFAVSGLEGTLRRRLTRFPFRGRVHGKTGTLNHVSALAGFATNVRSGGDFGFVVLTDMGAGHAVPLTTAHMLQDRIAMLLVR